MKPLLKIIIFCCLLFPLRMISQLSGQEQSISIRGSVKEKATREPIADVTVRVLGGGSTNTDFNGNFRITAHIGDELIIAHNDFETVYYTIRDGQRIDVLVEDNREKEALVTQRKTKMSRIESKASSERASRYDTKLDAARSTLKKDAEKSIEYITAALEMIAETDVNVQQKKATLYEVLGDIYRYWKQPDLAESNYETSKSYKNTTAITIKLGQSQLEGTLYDKAIATFGAFDEEVLIDADRILVFEGLGDGYKGLKKNDLAIANYQKALQIAQNRNARSQLIVLQTKMGELYQQQGKSDAAAGYYDQSLVLANKQDKKTAAKQKNIAADFYNKNNSYEKEITLRKEVLEDIQEAVMEEEVVVNEIEDEKATTGSSVDSIVTPSDNPVSSQVQNYKIARAFAAQKDFDEAIDFLKESIKQSEKKNDLVVQKDATRKLGQVYRQKGDLKKAAEAFESYEYIIDKLYIQKEQEISQAARFSKLLSSKQNRITSLEKDRELNESRYKLAFASQELVAQRSLQQQLIIYALIGLTLLLLFAGYLMYRNIKQQRDTNNLLALKSLRSQMNPHFIFNALNSVNTFIATSDERAANKYLTDFSLLMRSVLENSEEDFIPLAKEIELLERYTQLEHFRFQDKFDYQIEVDPEIVLDAYSIPPMLLQPYVENAVWHGLRYREEKGRLQIYFERLGSDHIRITITDDGIGRKKSKELKTDHQKKQQSKGMSNIKNRIRILNKMYKDRVTVNVTDLNEGGEGTSVQVVLKAEA